MLAPPPRALNRSQQKIVLVAALVAGLVEILGLLEIIPRVRIGRLLISPSVVPAFVVLGLLGRRAAGRARDLDAAAMYWVTVGAGICLSVVLLDREGHLVDSLAIALAAIDEEIVFRFAVPTVIAAVLLTFQVPSRPARVAGFVVAGVWFVLLPGHQDQVQRAGDVLPFIAFAALAAIVVYRSGSILAAAATHAVMNMLTIISFGGDMSPIARATTTAILLLLLVSGYGFVRPRGADADGEPVPSTVIDLRDGVAPTISEAGGPPRPVLEHDPADVPADTRSDIG
jgi:membrane protease YdiL (CAAX protease family)